MGVKEVDVTGGVEVGSTRVKALCNSMLKKRKKRGKKKRGIKSIRPNTIHCEKTILAIGKFKKNPTKDRSCCDKIVVVMG